MWRELLRQQSQVAVHSSVPTEDVLVAPHGDAPTVPWFSARRSGRNDR